MLGIIEGPIIATRIQGFGILVVTRYVAFILLFIRLGLKDDNPKEYTLSTV